MTEHHRLPHCLCRATLHSKSTAGPEESKCMQCLVPVCSALVQSGPLYINARHGAVYWCRQHGTRGARTSTFLRASRGLARARRLRPVHNR